MSKEDQVSGELLPYQDRPHAGRVLAEELRVSYETKDSLVVALAPDGVPIAREVALALGVKLDIIVAHNLCLQKTNEWVMGAISSGGVTVRNGDVLANNTNLQEEFKKMKHRAQAELLLQEIAYRGKYPSADMDGQTVVVVDDGLCSGFRMRAAILTVERRGAKRIIIAVPVGAADSLGILREITDDIVCPARPSPFATVGSYYMNYPLVTDGEVHESLEIVRSNTDKDGRLDPESGR